MNIKSNSLILYYSVQQEENIKSINLYEIKNNIPMKIAELECLIGFCTNEEEIQQWLDDNGYGEKDINFIELKSTPNKLDITN